MNYNEMDKLFRDRLRHKTANFDEQYWPAMEAILNKRKRRKRLLTSLLLLPALMLVLTGGYFYFQGNNGLFTVGKDEAEVEAQLPKQDTSGFSNDNTAAFTIPNRQPFSNNPLWSPHPFDRKKGEDQQTYQGKAAMSLMEGAKGGESVSSNSQTIKNPSSPDRIASNAETEEQNNRESQSDDPRQNENKLSNKAQQIVLLHKLPLKVAKLPEIGKNSTLADTLPDDAIDDKELTIPRTFEMGITGGAQLTGQYQQGSFQNFSAEPVIGAYFRWYTINNLYLNAELLYYYVPAPDYRRTVTNEEYGFGYQATTTTLDLKTAHYLQLPVYLDYQLLGAHGITGGIKGSWLINATGKIITTRSTTLSRDESSSTTTHVYPDGINPLQFEAVLGYRFDYNERFRLQLRGLYGLEHVKNEGYSPRNNYKNAGIQLLLQYRIH